MFTCDKEEHHMGDSEKHPSKEESSWCQLWCQLGLGLD